MSVGAVNKSTGDRIPTAGMPAIDAALSGSSTNPVQNMVVKAALDGKVDAESGKGLSTNDYTNADKAIVDGVTTALAGKVDTSSVGSASGVAELDTNGKVPSSQLPSYVDDVLEYASQSAFPAEGETGKIYIAKDTNKTYRWSGTAYVEISESLALGETSSTAYAGNKGRANADAISAIKDGTSIDSFADVETALANKQDAYETITYAQWQALTPAQQAAKDYYISDYPASAITAGNISYDNTTSGMAANKVQGAIDELKSGLNDLQKVTANGNITTFDTWVSTGVGHSTLEHKSLIGWFKSNALSRTFCIAAPVSGMGNTLTPIIVYESGNTKIYFAKGTTVFNMYVSSDVTDLSYSFMFI